MADVLGVYGTYDGPNGGAPKSDDDDLHNNGDNPFDYANGRTLPHDAYERDSAYPTMASISGAQGVPSIPGYYSNPVPDPDNPFHPAEGARTGFTGYSPSETELARSIASGMEDNLRQQLSDWTRGNDAPNPVPGDQYQHDIRVDNGQDDQLVPPKDWR